MATTRYGKTGNKKRATCLAKLLQNKLNSQPSPQAFSARSFLDSTMSCDVTERYSSALSQTLHGEQIKRERLGTRLSQPKSRVLYATRMRVSSHFRRSLFRWTFYRKISRIPNNVQITQQQQCRNSRDVKQVHREP